MGISAATVNSENPTFNERMHLFSDNKFQSGALAIQYPLFVNDLIPHKKGQQQPGKQEGNSRGRNNTYIRFAYISISRCDVVECTELNDAYHLTMRLSVKRTAKVLLHADTFTSP